MAHLQRGTEKYTGDILGSCNPDHYDFDETYAVVVSGSGINWCGHMLLNTGGRKGWYFHVAGAGEIYDYPRYMNYQGYLRYLRENGKHEITRIRIAVPNPPAATWKLEELAGKKWLWGVLPHNCARFVEVVVQAGGAKFGLLTNCPTRLD